MKFLLFIVFTPIIAYSQGKNDFLILENQKKIEVLNQSFNELHNKHDYQIRINEQTLNSISNQIAATSFHISIFAILFSVAAIVLAIYVTWVERKIIRLKQENESLLKETKDTKKEVVEINDLIQKDIYGLFLKIKREETRHIIDRLIKIPEDISNFESELLSRELHEEDFVLLKTAYLGLPIRKQEPGIQFVRANNKSQYLILFFQHFLGLSIKDDHISSDIIDFFPQGFECAFENDIIKSTEDFIKALIDLGLQSKSKEISSFLAALSDSSFKDSNKVYSIIFQSLKTRNNHFKFFDIISNEQPLDVIKKNYGLVLTENYHSMNLSISEKETIDEIKKINLVFSEKAEEKTV